MGVVHGVDLGTTNSCIARLDDHENPIVIQNLAEAGDTVASAVYFESESNVIVGAAAKDMVEEDGEHVVQFVKREIGKKDGRTYEFYGKKYTPVEISALILQRLKNMAEEQGEKVEKVVITCPAYFGIEERNATRAAGELIGLEVLDIVNEPTAAALSYCARQFKEERTLMVYDLGGGTFDVTIMRMSLAENEEGQEVQRVTVVASGGNDRLGGKDWDDILYGMIESVCCEENGLTPKELEPETRQSIRSKVETTKKKLSSAESAKVKVSVNGQITNVVISREEFEQMTAPKVAQTMGYVENVLKEAGNPQLDFVLLVGGSTFMPMIRNAVEARFSGIPVNLYEPNLAVAKGAAIYAHMIVEEPETEPAPSPDPVPNPDPTPNPDPHGEEKEIVKPPIDIVDQLPRSFGPGVLNENNEYIIDNLVKKGSTSPTEVKREYYTPRDNMKMIRLKVFESMSLDDVVIPCEDGQGNPMPSDPAYAVKYLGRLEMEMPPGTPADSKILVTFRADMTGIHVKTLDVRSGTEKEEEISFLSDVDKENSPVHTLRVDGE